MRSAFHLRADDVCCARALTDAASELAKADGRQTILCKDVYVALEDMDFGDLLPDVKEKAEGVAPKAASGGAKAAAAAAKDASPQYESDEEH